MYIYYALASAFAISAVSAVGMLFLFSKEEIHSRKVHTFLALAAGAMLGNALLHLLPHALTLETQALESGNPPAIVEMLSGDHCDHCDHGHESAAPKNFAPHLEEYIQKNGGHDHSGHDHAAHKEHDDHAGHDHAAHKEHDDHAGHDHAAHKEHDDHAGHDHGSHKDHDDHAGTNQGSHAGHDHAGHGHTGLFSCIMLLLGLGLFGTFDLLLKGAHSGTNRGGISSEGYMVVVADMVENLLDGVVIGTAYMLSPAAGFAATIAIFFHEIPLEIGDFAVLRHSGFSQRKALALNLLSGLMSVVGVAVAVLLGMTLNGFALYATPLAAGGFLYIASAILIPKLRNQNEGTTQYMIMCALGVAVMVAIMFFE